MKRVSAFIWLFIVLCFPCLPADSQLPKKDFSGKAPYRVARVIDGDTVVLSVNGKDETVRLIGVDTPETVDPRKPVEQYGIEASNFTKNLLIGEEVWAESDPTGDTRDKYQRLLAYLYRVPDGLFVNHEIIRQGYGHAYTQFPFQYIEAFREAERKARESEKGLWSPSEKKPLSRALSQEQQIELSERNNENAANSSWAQVSVKPIPTPEYTPRPIAYEQTEAETEYSGGSSSSAGPKTVHVRGYYRKDGTYVRPHTRSAPRR